MDSFSRGESPHTLGYIRGDGDCCTLYLICQAILLLNWEGTGECIDIGNQLLGLCIYL